MLQDLQWDGWRKEIDVMGRIMEGIGTVIITILKWIGKNHSWGIAARSLCSQDNSSSIRFGGKIILINC